MAWSVAKQDNFTFIFCLVLCKQQRYLEMCDKFQVCLQVFCILNQQSLFTRFTEIFMALKSVQRKLYLSPCHKNTNRAAAVISGMGTSSG